MTGPSGPHPDQAAPDPVRVRCVSSAKRKQHRSAAYLVRRLIEQGALRRLRGLVDGWLLEDRRRRKSVPSADDALSFGAAPLALEEIGETFGKVRSSTLRRRTAA